MVIAIFRTTRSLSGNFVDNKKGISTQNPRGAAKHLVVSQVTILSAEATFEAEVDTSQPMFSDEDSQQRTPLMLPSEITFPQSTETDSVDTNE